MVRISTVVESPGDSFKWPWYYSQQVGHDKSVRAFHELDGMTLQTFFSGICAPSTGATGLLRAMSEAAGVSQPTGFRYLSACDVEPECRYECGCLPHRPKCMFGDVLSFLTPAGRTAVKDLGSYPTLDDYIRVIIDTPGNVSLTARCYFCGDGEGSCTLNKSADTIVAGSPCVD